MTDKNQIDIEVGEKSRRRFIQVTVAGGAASLAGCFGGGGTETDGSSGGGGDDDSGGGGDGNSGGGSSGDGRTIETRFWDEWPIETKNNDNVQFEYTAVEGEPLAPLTTHFAQKETPWMREHALMIKRSFEELGAPVSLKNVLPSNRYGEFWRADTGHTMPVTMNLHGPDPQRGLDPNPFLMRAHPETGGNYYNYNNDEVTELLNEQSSEIESVERRAELCGEVQRKLNEDAYLISTCFPQVITAANVAEWEGYVPTPGNGTTGDSFVWTHVNLQPTGDASTWVKGVATAMDGTNLPWSSGGPKAKRLTNIYDGLYDASPQLEIVPGLATNADVVDPTTIEMDLREGVTWHDGESFGPDDVKFSVEVFKEFTAPQMGPFVRSIDSVEVLSSSGGGRVRFNLKEPDAAFLTQRVVRSAIIPKHRWEDVDNPAEFSPDEPVGTGPFQFNSWDQGSRFVLDKYEDHWMWDDDVREELLGEYFTAGDGIDQLVYANVGSTSTLIGALQAGDIDAIGGTLSNEQANRASNASGVERQTAETYVPLDVHLNHIVPLIRDKTFRVALSHTVDKQGFVDTVLSGRATVAKGQNLITPLMSPFYTETEPYEHDPERGKQLLERAGYTVNDDGTLVWPEGDAWDAFEARVEDGHATRSELDQPDFS